jgi:5-methylcytosine-specific restriction endonuclease McrA
MRDIMTEKKKYITQKEKNELRLKLYKRDGKRCHYYSIREEDFIRIWGRFYKVRGKRLELERKDNEKGYTLENCVLSCSICNNAKSDKFTYEEFKKVGEAIKEVWLLRKKGLTLI